jgi:hypothetical protein
MTDPHELCSHAADIAAEFPRSQPVDIDPAADIGTEMTSCWNVALPRAAGLLARSLIEMTSRRMTETILVRRALMELYANLAVLNKDPAKRCEVLAGAFRLQREAPRQDSAVRDRNR